MSGHGSCSMRAMAVAVLMTKYSCAACSHVWSPPLHSFCFCILGCCLPRPLFCLLLAFPSSPATHNLQTAGLRAMLCLLCWPWLGLSESLSHQAWLKPPVTASRSSSRRVSAPSQSRTAFFIQSRVRVCVCVWCCCVLVVVSLWSRFSHAPFSCLVVNIPISHTHLSSPPPTHSLFCFFCFFCFFRCCVQQRTSCHCKMSDASSTASHHPACCKGCTTLPRTLPFLVSRFAASWTRCCRHGSRSREL